ncbi:hypothetical protein C2S51_006929 [Perilla frutescens var. frutescens]|nr:hypothetical protein C2S51_006929 [Perilla frutescens var. frutescens]
MMLVNGDELCFCCSSSGLLMIQMNSVDMLPSIPKEHLDNWLCEDCECSSKSCPTRDLWKTGYISAEEVTEVSSGAMESFTTLMVTSNSCPLQPKIEVNLFSEDDHNLGPFQQLETQLLDSMEISEQQSSHSIKPEDILMVCYCFFCPGKVFGEEYMHEVVGVSNMHSPGNKNLACLDDMSPKHIEGQPVNDMPIVGRSSTATNAADVPTQKQRSVKGLKHADRLRKYLKEKHKIPITFRKKDGLPVGKYASLFKTELGIAVKKFAPLQVSGWKNITEEQKRPIFHRLESAFTVDFGLGPSLVKKETENLMSRRYRDYRQKMHEHYKTFMHMPWEDRLKHVPKEHCRSEADWEFMCKMFESETFKKASAINSGNRAKTKPSYIYRGGSKSLSQYKYDVDNGSEENDDTTISNVTNSSQKNCPGETAETAKSNNDEQIGLENHDDGSQSLEEVTVAKRARDQVQESRAGHVAVLGNWLDQPAKRTCCDATSLIATIAELRKELVSTQDELHSTRAALQLTEDKTQMLEANQKRLEETVQASTQIVEANQRMMKRVFERLATDIAQSLSSTPPPPHL